MTTRNVPRGSIWRIFDAESGFLYMDIRTPRGEVVLRMIQLIQHCCVIRHPTRKELPKVSSIGFKNRQDMEDGKAKPPPSYDEYRQEDHSDVGSSFLRILRNKNQISFKDIGWAVLDPYSPLRFRGRNRQTNEDVVL